MMFLARDAGGRPLFLFPFSLPWRTSSLFSHDGLRVQHFSLSWRTSSLFSHDRLRVQHFSLPWRTSSLLSHGGLRVQHFSLPWRTSSLLSHDGLRVQHFSFLRYMTTRILRVGPNSFNMLSFERLSVHLTFCSLW